MKGLGTGTRTSSIHPSSLSHSLSLPISIPFSIPSPPYLLLLILLTDDEKLVEVITHNTNEQLQAIQQAYKHHHSKTLIEDIKGDTSGDYRDLLSMQPLLSPLSPSIPLLYSSDEHHRSKTLIEELKRDASGDYRDLFRM